MIRQLQILWSLMFKVHIFSFQHSLQLIKKAGHFWKYTAEGLSCVCIISTHIFQNTCEIPPSLFVCNSKSIVDARHLALDLLS